MGPDRDRRRRHARADQAGAHRGAAEHRDRAPRGRAVRPRGAAAHGRGMAGARGHGPREGGQPAAGRALDRRQVELGRRAMSSGGDDESRPHVVAVDYGNKRNIFRNSGRGRRAGDGGARDRDVRRDHGARARRLLPVERPRRSGGDRRICGAGDPADAGDEEAAVRHLPRPPDAGARGWRQDDQDVPGPSRRQPPGQAPGRRPRSRSPA